jgi:hypothetical protein
MYVYTIYTRPLSVQAQYSKSCPIINFSCYNGVSRSCSLYSLGKDRTENTASNSFIIAYMFVAAIT